MSNDEDLELAQDIEIEGTVQTVTLAALAGIDLSDTAEKRGSNVPAGTYIFEFAEDSDGKKPGWRAVGQAKKLAAVFPMTIVDVIGVVDKTQAPNGDPLQLIGKQHRENIFMTAADSKEYLAAFLVDTGIGKKGTAGELFAACLGRRFQGSITTRKDKNDESIVYHSLNRQQGKIKPVVMAS